jgi:hypothetical protein
MNCESVNIPLRNPEILLEEIGEEAFLYNPGDDALHVINPTALTVWNKCDGTHSVEDIGSSLRTDWKCPEDTDVDGDVREIVAGFSALGVLA